MGKHEDEQETVSTQRFIRNCISSERASAFQLTKNRVSLKRLIDAESDLLPQKFARNTENSFKIVPRVEVKNSSNNIRQRKNLIDELKKFRREPSPDFEREDSDFILPTQKTVRMKSKHKRENPKAKDVESVKRDIFADMETEE